MLDWTNQELAKIFIAISEPANCRIDCSQPPIFFNAKISNAENSERERKRAVGARLLSLLVKPFCARVQISRDPLCAGFNFNEKIEGCEQGMYVFKGKQYRYFLSIAKQRKRAPFVFCN